MTIGSSGRTLATFAACRIGTRFEARKVPVNGPVRRADDPRFRGMTIYSVPVDEARRLALADPAVQAGWFEPHVDGWLIPAQPVTLGTRVDVEFPND